MPARVRILDLQAELEGLGWTWTPPSRPRPPTSSRRHPLTRDLADASPGAFWVTFAVASLGIYVVGIITILRAIC
jgi:hypothetical protein